MKTVRMKIDVQSPNAKPIGRIDVKRVDATTEADIAKHQAEDDANAALDSAKFARRVRRRLGFSQVEFAERIDVSLDTIRNWEQGKRCPTGAAKALLKVLDKAPEACNLIQPTRLHERASVGKQLGGVGRVDGGGAGGSLSASKVSTLSCVSDPNGQPKSGRWPPLR